MLGMMSTFVINMLRRAAVICRSRCASYSCCSMCLTLAAYVSAKILARCDPRFSSICCNTCAPLSHASEAVDRDTGLLAVLLYMAGNVESLLPSHFQAGRLCTRLLALLPLLRAVITRSAATISTIMKATCS